MTKAKLKLALVAIACTGLLLPLSLAFNETSLTFAQDNVIWRHYNEVAPTGDKNGCKEYWTDCNGITVIENPGGVIQDYGTPSDEFVSNLPSSDERFIPSNNAAEGKAAVELFYENDNYSFNMTLDTVISNNPFSLYQKTFADVSRIFETYFYGNSTSSRFTEISNGKEYLYDRYNSTWEHLSTVDCSYDKYAIKYLSRSHYIFPVAFDLIDLNKLKKESNVFYCEELNYEESDEYKSRIQKIPMLRESYMQQIEANKDNDYVRFIIGEGNTINRMECSFLQAEVRSYEVNVFFSTVTVKFYDFGITSIEESSGIEFLDTTSAADNIQQAMECTNVSVKVTAGTYNFNSIYKIDNNKLYIEMKINSYFYTHYYEITSNKIYHFSSEQDGNWILVEELEYIPIFTPRYFLSDFYSPFKNLVLNPDNLRLENTTTAIFEPNYLIVFSPLLEEHPEFQQELEDRVSAATDEAFIRYYFSFGDWELSRIHINTLDFSTYVFNNTTELLTYDIDYTCSLSDYGTTVVNRPSGVYITN